MQEPDGIELDVPSSKLLTNFLASERYQNLLRDSPATARLQHAMYEVLAILFTALGRAASAPSRDTHALTLANPLVISLVARNTARKIATWLFGPEWPAEIREHTEKFMSEMIRDGDVSFAEARELLDEFLPPKRGRPVTHRHTAVAALDLKLANPKRWSWAKLARRFCVRDDCEHANECVQRLRQEVMALQRFLKALDKL